MNESLPSFKNSIGISYGNILSPLAPNVLQTATAELSYSNPFFLKFSGQRVQLFELWKNKLNLVVRLEGGHLLKFGAGRMHINDRFFINSTQCFSQLGHFQRSNVPLDPHSVQTESPPSSGCARVILGDDLGAETFGHINSRIDFLNVPFLRKYNVRPFVFGELVVYPAFGERAGSVQELLRKSSRGGVGFGICIPLPIGQGMNIQLYHNAMVFNGDPRGDITRNSFINMDFGFF